MGLGFDGLYGQDSYEYTRYAKALKSYFYSGAPPGDVVWPKAYLSILAIGSFVFPVELAGQLISLVSIYGIYFFVLKTIDLIYGKSNYTPYFLLLSLLFSPYVLRLGVVVMADTFAMLTIVGALYYSVLYTKTNAFKALAFSVLFGTLGVFSRYAVLIPLFPILIYSFRHWLVLKKSTHLLTLLIPVLFFYYNYSLEGNGSKFINHHLIESWSAFNVFKSEFIAAPDSGLTDKRFLFPNGVYHLFIFFHPGFSFLLGCAYIFSIKKLKGTLSYTPMVILSSIVGYSFFLSGIAFQSSRYIALTYPLFVIISYPLWQALISKVSTSYKSYIYTATACVQLVLFYYAILPSYHMNRIERKTADILSEFEGQTLYSFELDVALQQRGLNLKFNSLWEKEYDHFETNGLVLFNESRYEQNYKGLNPMINWNKVNNDHALIEIRNIDSGWKLYKIE